MAKLVYCFQTDDPVEAASMASRLGIAFNVATAAQGSFPAGPGLQPAAGTVAPPAAPAAPAAYTPPPVAPAYAPPAAAAPPPPAPAAPAPHDAEDQNILAAGWALDTHIKPKIAEYSAKYPGDAPLRIKAHLDSLQPGAKVSTIAPKHWPKLYELLSA